MKSTGNDIVALNAIDIQRTNIPAFYSKIITANEQSLYHAQEISAMPFENFVWLLWSVKESVYKYLKRNDSALIFPPTKIIIQNISAPAGTSLFDKVWESEDDADGFYTGKVIYNDIRLFFRSKITVDFIATVVNDFPAFKNVYWGVKLISYSDNASQSKAVRDFAAEKLQSVLKTDNLSIEKNVDGCPIVLKEEGQINIPVSLAHHGHFVAYSFAI